ncbi:MAG: hypothetical protein JSS11_09085 [Verrucomicrobia bacterium]|nr:hypothetical protein [Verrucomicrobiota bacterium]
MSTSLLRLLALAGLLAFASLASSQAQGTPPAVPIGNSIPGGSRVIVALGYTDYSGIQPIMAIPPPPPVNVQVGSGLTITTGYDDATIESVQWTKNDIAIQNLPVGFNILSFASATEADSGYYSAAVTIGGVVKPTNRILIRVTNPPRQQLLNLSSRTTISPANPNLIGGFVIAASPGQLNESKQLFIRAVGPSLAAHGVAQPLLHPTLHLFRANGSEVPVFIPASSSPYHSAFEQATGAFPLPPGSDDAATVVTLPAGVYSVHASSKDGGTGDVLLEIYEVPASTIQIPFTALPTTVPSNRPGGN